MPRQAEPEAAIVGCIFVQRDYADVVFRRLLQSKGPMPFVPTLDCRESCVAIEGECAVGGIRPWNNSVQIFDDLPLREEQLGLRGIGKLKRPQEKARSVEFDGLDMCGHWQQYMSGARWTPDSFVGVCSVVAAE